MDEEKDAVDITLPLCPECSGDMVGFTSNPQAPDEGFLIWSCRACGATFVYDEHYNLQPYVIGLF